MALGFNLNKVKMVVMLLSKLIPSGSLEFKLPDLWLRELSQQGHIFCVEDDDLIE